MTKLEINEILEKEFNNSSRTLLDVLQGEIIEVTYMATVDTLYCSFLYKIDKIDFVNKIITVYLTEDDIMRLKKYHEI